MYLDIINRIKDWNRSHRLEDLDWITRNRLKMKKVVSQLSHISPNPNSKKILCWSMTPWERGAVEHMLSLSLQLRGHNVSGVSCDGGFSACSMESFLYKKPDCDSCIKRNKKIQGIFGLSDNYQSTSQFITKEEIQKINTLCQNLSIDAMRNYVYKGISVGKILDRDLPQYYFKMVDMGDSEVVGKAKETLASIICYTEASFNAINTLKPSICIVTSGKTTSHSGFYAVCKHLNIPVVTWDEGVGGIDSFIFKINESANEYHLTQAWEKIENEPLTKKELDFLDYFFKQTEQGKFGRFSYYKNPIKDEAKLRESLSIDPHKKVLVCLTNLTWDTSALGRDVGFSGMLDWIFTTIDSCLTRDDIHLIIRCHPVEGHAPDYAQSAELVSDIIARKYPNLPNHIRVIRGEEEHSSHALASLSDLTAVYTTTVALEMAMKGRKVFICGNSHFRENGFTTDISTKEEYLKLLEKEDTYTNKHIDPFQIEKAKKYAYLFIVRSQAYLPEFHQDTRHTFEINNPEDFLPGKSKRWDALAENVINEGNFTDTSDYIDPWDK